MKKKPITPRSRARNAIRRLWLTSRERAEALRLASYTCQRCGRKKSTAKGKEFDVHVHHRAGITGWDRVLSILYAEILCPPDQLEVLCPKCHNTLHEKEKT